MKKVCSINEPRYNFFNESSKYPTARNMNIIKVFGTRLKLFDVK